MASGVYTELQCGSTSSWTPIMGAAATATRADQSLREEPLRLGDGAEPRAEDRKARAGAQSRS